MENFLKPERRISVEISNQAFEHFPEISPEELESKQERYFLLLGNSGIEGSVKINGVMQLEDTTGFYQEGRESVAGVNISALKSIADGVRTLGPEYTSWHFVGEMHTHPVIQEELDVNQRSHHPSEEDIQAWIACYERGELTGDTPFIFAIAGAQENGSTGYAYYRVVKESDRLVVVSVAEHD